MNAPHNEAETILWFEREGPAHGYRIETLRTSYPDAVIRHEDKTLLVEFEYESDNFFAHSHNPDRCDLIVCWHHNGRKLPLPCLELQLETWWERAHAAYAAPAQLSLNAAPVYAAEAIVSDGATERYIADLEARNRALELKMQQSLAEWKTRLDTYNNALSRAKLEVAEQRQRYREELKRQRDFFLKRLDSPGSLVDNGSLSMRTHYGYSEVGRPLGDIGEIAELIIRLKAELGRNPSSNQIYFAGREIWGHGPNRDKVKRAWEMIESGEMTKIQ